MYPSCLTRKVELNVTLGAVLFLYSRLSVQYARTLRGQVCHLLFTSQMYQEHEY